MERVVYILGAGFSAPLGLPVMNDLMIKAKDLYANSFFKKKLPRCLRHETLVRLTGVQAPPWLCGQSCIGPLAVRV